MIPAGPLMIEHRLIERMIGLLEKELKSIKAKEKVNLSLIDSAIDFIKNYADRCHHGKEEDILFSELEKKNLPDVYKNMIKELVEDHKYGRKLTGELLEAKNRYSSGFTSSIFDIIDIIGKLVDFYPKHIEKEDKHFFLPMMDYFTRKEQDEMLNEFWEFDKKLIHEEYSKIVEKYE
jgi:hemerythrin-like domain-containing protein